MTKIGRLASGTVSQSNTAVNIKQKITEKTISKQKNEKKIFSSIIKIMERFQVLATGTVRYASKNTTFSPVYRH
jgi:hypothetical protein